MESGNTPTDWNDRDRVVAILQGRKPDRIPFVDRLSLWYDSLSQAGALPPEFAGMTIDSVHRAVGMGRQLFIDAFALKLHGVEVRCRFGDRIVYQDTDPVIGGFPTLWGAQVVPRTEAGTTTAELITPAGQLRIQWRMTDSMLSMGSATPYACEHPIKEESDYSTVEWILDRAEVVPCFDDVYAAQDNLGGDGFVVPNMYHIPFQDVLLSYVGEVPLFYALHDTPRRVERLLELLDRLALEVLDKVAGLSSPFVEYDDNIEAEMTNPRLFRQYCLPAYQRYTEVLHAQGKKVGCHADGEVRPLLHLLRETGLDVFESFSPSPMTRCTFEEAWQAWKGGPIIWGGIPSVILEPSTPEQEFRNYVRETLELVGSDAILLGIGDQVMPGGLIERIRYIADQLK